jgi:hypothetical protein
MDENWRPSLPIYDLDFGQQKQICCHRSSLTGHGQTVSLQIHIIFHSSWANLESSCYTRLQGMAGSFIIYRVCQNAVPV